MIVNTHLIEEILAEAKSPSQYELDRIFSLAERHEPLSLEDIARLLLIDSPDALNRLYRKAGELKERVFGKRIVLFAPLYLSNFCNNNCVYCGFRKDNISALRKRLSVEEVVKEAKHLEGIGFKRTLLVSGEDESMADLDYIIAAVTAIYKETGIRIVHMNAPPMDISGFRLLKEAGVGVYQCFQETYHRDTYKHVHPSGRKSDYDYRLDVMDRAVDAGFEDVGIGALLGLYDYRFDCLATIVHSRHLYERYGAHAHTISVPRLRPAPGSTFNGEQFRIRDEAFKKVIAVLRLAVPSAGIVVTTREGKELRSEVMKLGASQVSAASNTAPGGYTQDQGHKATSTQNQALKQFETDDDRTLEEVMSSILKAGLMPSLCTSCYRVGRTGDKFTEMTLMKSMERLCKANALLTLQEFILDYAENGVMELGERAIERGLDAIKESPLKKEILKGLDDIKNGKRDIHL